MSDDEIKAVAIGICEALGLDPFERVQAGEDQIDTPQERTGNSMTSMSWQVDRWQKYRWQAAMAIATERALGR